jgi:hypothetical protein
MMGADPPDGGNDAFDVALDPAPEAEVVDAAEDEGEAARRAAALASTFDPAIAHAGKTNEEMIAEREAQARLLADAVLALGVVIAVAEAEAASVTADTLADAAAQNGEPETEDGPPTDMQDGD